jgi:hypothetical protein
MNENLDFKVDKVTFTELVKFGIPSNSLGLVFQEYQKKYGKENVWSDSKAFYIKTQINAQ